jgi:hypothetical protein
MARAIEAFSWGQRAFCGGDEVADNDPAVVKFPHLFEIDAPVAPVKRGPGRPRKVVSDD